MDIGRSAGFDTWQFKGVEGCGAVVEEQQVASVLLGMPGIDAFIFAIENPESVEHCRHPGHGSSLAERVKDDLAIIQRHPGEGPDVRRAGGSVDAVPAV